MRNLISFNRTCEAKNLGILPLCCNPNQAIHSCDTRCQHLPLFTCRSKAASVGYNTKEACAIPYRSCLPTCRHPNWPVGVTGGAARAKPKVPLSGSKPGSLQWWAIVSLCYPCNQNIYLSLFFIFSLHYRWSFGPFWECLGSLLKDLLMSFYTFGIIFATVHVCLHNKEWYCYP